MAEAQINPSRAGRFMFQDDDMVWGEETGETAEAVEYTLAFTVEEGMIKLWRAREDGWKEEGHWRRDDDGNLVAKGSAETMQAEFGFENLREVEEHFRNRSYSYFDISIEKDDDLEELTGA